MNPNSTLNEIQEILKSVSDPEIPVLTIEDLGIIKEIEIEDKEVTVTITPTYSGCPAMDVIGDDIKSALQKAGYTGKIKLVLSPAWTTDWISESGRKKMKDYGIAPPMDASMDKRALLHGERIVKCTRCGSTNTKLISQFGSTACKALFQCQDCHEPFDYFKCL
jgi:ring-1,2-phenylacetyl-CoA epoxidase subunit PaaD